MPKESVRQNYGYYPFENADALHAKDLVLDVAWAPDRREDRPVVGEEPAVLVTLTRRYEDVRGVVSREESSGIGLNRTEVNRVIKALRRARDQVFGKDE